MSTNDLLPDVKPVSFMAENALESWKRYKQKVLWAIDGLSKPSDKKKLSVLMTKIRDEGIHLYNTFQLGDDPTFEEVITVFDAHVAANTNLVYEDFQFLTSTQLPGQSIEAFVLQIKTRAAKCEFCSADTQHLIRDVLVMGILDKKLQRDLLKDKDLTLESAVMQCKIWEKAQRDSKVIATQVQESTSVPVPVD